MKPKIQSRTLKNLTLMTSLNLPIASSPDGAAEFVSAK